MKVYLLIYLVTIILCIIETNLEYVTIGVRKISTSVFSTIIIYPYILLLGVLRSEVLVYSFPAYVTVHFNGTSPS